jgi:glucose-1-phosphatase
MKKYQAILFDLGNVLLNYSFDLTFQKWAELTSYTPEYFKNHFQFDGKLLEYEKGHITSMVYFHYVTIMLEIKWTYEIFKTGWNAIHIGIPDGIYALLENLKSNYKLYILSNTNELHADFWKSHFSPLLRHFEGIYCSHELHAHKPEPEIFQMVSHLIKIPLEQLLFIDDMPENVSGAKKIGLDAILATSPSQLVGELKNFELIT